MRRRRVLAIFAAASGLGWPGRGARAAVEPLTWRGPVLGALGHVTLYHADRGAAERLIAAALAEVRRLEAVFSLWRQDSLIATLNRSGVLVAPPREMVELLERSRQAWAITGGAFDPTVQPLWELYAAHFGRRDADPGGPPEAALRDALARVGLPGLFVSADRLAFVRRGMAVTLNGIAQGYVTDRVVAVLRAGGIERTLVDMGEARAIGAHPSGRPWLASLDDPERPGHPWSEVDLTDRALASSGDAGFVFDHAGRFTHLMDPRSGRSPRLYRAVSVLAPDATTADALSTGFALMAESDIAAALRVLGNVAVLLLRHDESVVGLTAH